MTGSPRLYLKYEVDGQVRTCRLGGEIVRIGRGVDNEAVLPDPSVSRRHAVLRWFDGEGWVVEDRGSLNGVVLNGTRVDRGTVVLGDHLRIGRFDLTVAEEVSAAPWDDLADSSAGGVSLAESNATATIVRPLSEVADRFGLGGVADTGAEELKRRRLDEAYDSPIFGFLTRLGGLLLRAASPTEVFTAVLEVAFDALPVERGFVLLAEEGTEPVCEVARLGERIELRPRGEVPISQTILRRVLEDRVALVTLDAQTDGRLEEGASIRVHQIRAAMSVPLWSEDRILGILQVDTTERAGTFTEEDLDLLAALANFATVAAERLRFAATVEEEQRFRARLERYHSPAVVEAILEDQSAVERRLRGAEVTVLFADLVGFTTYAEGAQPEEVAELLEGFFGAAVDAVFDAGGTLDKFIGDCVMAFFGAPVAVDDHARRALDASIDLQRRLARWNGARRGAGRAALEARVALNTGRVVVGEVGDRRRVDYTVLGDAVNVAARLEAEVAQAGEIVLGEETARRLVDPAGLEPLGSLKLRGLRRPVSAYRVERSW